MRSWVVLAALVALQAGCPPTCDRSTCTGCCDVSGECLPGTSRNFCGAGGVVCGACPAGERCQAGTCIIPPDAGVRDGGPVATTCTTGCRDDALQCQPGNLPQACGADGGACVQCLPGQRCDRATCQSASCQGCVDAVGDCQRGTDAVACGLDGGVCQACTAGQTCALGACAATRCGAMNCANGCCRNDVCQLPSRINCGSFGIACVTCTGVQSCVGGVCQ